jgi:hypothetical protein
MMTGKTKQLNELIKDHARILLLSFRRTFGRDSASKNKF